MLWLLLTVNHPTLPQIFTLKISLSDALLQLENICEHVKYLSANVKFISNQMKQTPEILILEKDSVSVEQILEKAKVSKLLEMLLI